MACGPIAGLIAMDRTQLAADLDSYHWYHAARADLLRRAGYFAEAAAAYTRALALCHNEAERAFLAGRLAAQRESKRPDGAPSGKTARGPML